MAEQVNAGDVTARLRLDLSQWTQALQQAQRELLQFQHQAQQGRGAVLPPLVAPGDTQELQQAQRDLTAFQRQVQQGSRGATFTFDTAALRSSLAQAASAHRDFTQKIVAQQQTLTRALDFPKFFGRPQLPPFAQSVPAVPPVPAGLPLKQPGLPAGGHVLPPLAAAAALGGPPPANSIPLWQQLGATLAQFGRTWQGLQGGMGTQLAMMGTQFQQLGTASGTAGTGLLRFMGIAGATTVAVGLLTAGVLASSRSAALFGREITEEHAATGIAVRDLQALESLSRSVGQSMDTMHTTLRIVQRTASQAATNTTGKEHALYRMIGLSDEDIAAAQDPAKFMAFFTKLLTALKRLHEVNPAQGGQISSELLGRGYQSVALIADKLSQTDWTTIRRGMEAIHQPLSEERIRELSDYAEAWDRIGLKISNVYRLTLGAPAAAILGGLLGVGAPPPAPPLAPPRPSQGLEPGAYELPSATAPPLATSGRPGLLPSVPTGGRPAEPTVSATPQLDAEIEQRRLDQIKSLRGSELATLHELQAVDIERTQGVAAGVAARTRFKLQEIEEDSRFTRSLALNAQAVQAAQKAVDTAEKSGNTERVAAANATLKAAQAAQGVGFDEIKRQYESTHAQVVALQDAMLTTAQAPLFRQLAGEARIFGESLALDEQRISALRDTLRQLLREGSAAQIAARAPALVQDIQQGEHALAPQRLAQAVGREVQQFAQSQQQTQLKLDIALAIDPRPMTALQANLAALQARASALGQGMEQIGALTKQGGFTPETFARIQETMAQVALGSQTVEDGFANIQLLDPFQGSAEKAAQLHDILATLARDPAALAASLQNIPSMLDPQALAQLVAMMERFKTEWVGVNRAIEQTQGQQAFQQATQSLQAQAIALRDQLGVMGQSLDVQQRELIVREKMRGITTKGFTPSAGQEAAIRGQADEMVRLQHAYEDAERPLQAFAEAHQSAFVTMQRTTLQVLETSEQALVEFFVTGKASVQDFGQAIVRDLTTAFVRQTITKPLAGALNSLFPVVPVPDIAKAGEGGEGLSGAATQVTGTFQGLATAATELTTTFARMGVITESPLRRADGTLATGAPGTTATGSAGGDASALQGIMGRAGAPQPQGVSGLTALQQMVVAKAQAKGIDPSWALALARQESNWNPEATSPTGVRGLFQVTIPTGRPYGQTAANRTDPNVSADAGLGFFADLLKQTRNNYPVALARYNGGSDPNFAANVAQWRPGYQAMLAGASEGPFAVASGAPASPTAHSAAAQDAAYRQYWQSSGGGASVAAAPAVAPVTAVPGVAQELTGGVGTLSAAALQFQTAVQLFQTAVTAMPSAAPAPVAMARGGLVTRPTNALLGEAGPELVIPMAEGAIVEGGGDWLSSLWQKFVAFAGKDPESDTSLSGTDWETIKRKLAPVLGAAVGGSLPQLLPGGTDLTAEQEAYQKAFATHRDPVTGRLIQGGTYDYGTAQTTGGSDLTTSLTWASKVPGAAGYVKAPPSTSGGGFWRSVLSLLGSVAGAYAGKAAAGSASSGAGGAAGSDIGGGASYPQYASAYAAQGAVFRGPTLALLGEGGDDEAVIPLKRGGIPATQARNGQWFAHLPSGVNVPILPMPHFAEGGVVGGSIPTIGNNSWPAVGGSGRLGNGQPGGTQGGPLVVMHVSTPDVGSFRASSDQLMREASGAMRRAQMRNG